MNGLNPAHVDRGIRYARAKEVLDKPMTALALAFAVVLIIPLIADVSATAETVLDAVGWAIWALFVVEYAVLLWLAPDRKQMVREHPLELLLIVVPIFRPLRALRAFQVVIGAGTAFKTARAVLSRKGMQWFFVLAATIVGMGAVAALAAERKEPGAQITDIGDALWWALVTCTTVGYGDLAPITPAGRVIAAILMIVGISALAVITANIASVLVEEDTENDIARLESKIDNLTNEIRLLRTHTDNDTP